MTLWIVRHARPLIDPGVCYGALDIPADAQSTLEAAQKLALVLPERAHLHSSMLQRCELLTQYLCGLRPDLIKISEPRLVEMDFGIHEGKAWADIGKGALDAWTTDFANHRFGGQESVVEFMARVGAVWDECKAQSTTYPNQVWITHAGVARAAALLALGVRLPENASQWPKYAPDFGTWMQLPMLHPRPTPTRPTLTP